MRLIRRALPALAVLGFAQTSLAQQLAPDETSPGLHAYTDSARVRFAPAAGTDIGVGTTFPSVETTALHLAGRLGASAHLTPSFSLVLAVQTGADLAFNTGSSSPFYGYFVRLPLDVVLEGIFSHLVKYDGQHHLNLHLGVAGGGDLLLAAQCVAPNCNYAQPNMSPGLSARVGLSYSAVERNSVGLFFTFAQSWTPCPVNVSNESCLQSLQAIFWSVGWTLF